MKKCEKLIREIVKRTGLYKKEINELVREKQAEVKTIMSKERMLLLLARDLGVSLVY